MKLKTLAFLPAVLLATSIPSVEAGMGKFSLGARIGYNNLNLDGRGSGTGTNFFVAAPTAPNKNFTHGYGGLEGDIFVSKEKSLGMNWCYGGELFVGSHNTDTGRVVHDTGDGVARTSVKQDFSFGARLKLGYKWSPKTTFYGILGTTNSSFVIDHSYRDGAGASFGGTSPAGSLTRKSLWAIVPGIGVRYKLSPRWNFNVEATYAIYQTWSKEISGTSDAANFLYTFKMRPKEAGISFGFSRKF